MSAGRSFAGWLACRTSSCRRSGLTAQSFAERFADRFSVGDTAAARQVLRQWEASAERPAEFFVAGLNYCFRMARHSLIVLGDGPGNGPTLETVDPAGSCRELSLSEAVRYDTALVRRGIAYIDRGIEAYPLRLDMRFGKIHALGEIGDYGRYVDAIVDAVAASADNACRWLWSDDRPLEDGREFMLSAVQDYVNRLYELGTDEGLDGMDRIASTVLGIYPDHVESLDNAAIVRIVRGRYDEAKPLLMRAEPAGSARYDDTGQFGRVARSAGRPSGRGDLLSQNGGLRGRFRPGLRFAAAPRVGGERVIFRGYGYGRCAGGFARNAFRSRGKSAGIVRWASEFL